MNKKFLNILIMILSIALISIISLFGYKIWQIKNTEIIVDLNDNLDVDVFSKVKVSDFIENINGKIVDDYQIKTNKIGVKDVTFDYINNDKIKIEYTFKINIKDKVAPIIKSPGKFISYKGNKVDFSNMFCGDNYDDNPVCEVIGDYDNNKNGVYPLIFRGTDISGNMSENKFNLVIKDKPKPISSTNNKNKYESKLTDYNEIIKKYKNRKTKIGIDVSKWQGNIDFEKINKKEIEFAFIRVGSQKGIGGEYILDPKFKRNIEGFKEKEIPVGIYFYSYADSKDEAKKQAKWVLNQIKEYEIELPIVFDWECWNYYQYFHKSFYNLTEISKSYLNTIKKAGYKPMLYSSKYYLENIWFDTDYDIWLAHYTDKTNYEGNYKYWQLTSTGKVEGIKGPVDINVMYK